MDLFQPQQDQDPQQEVVEEGGKEQPAQIEAASHLLERQASGQMSGKHKIFLPIKDAKDGPGPGARG